MVTMNSFTLMPKGRLQVEVIGKSKFSKDNNIEYKDLMLKLSQTTSKEQERLSYVMSTEGKTFKQKILLDTFYYDDILKVEVYHRG